ncbi:hypothetical protein GUJ93_ZPchr0008g13660 [Zizania palustris]|uniref:Uncharacterized protein n=1 Tax=Zizania palustris TaxID=103762 RepID=A0A8J5V221_ZIZPA|nr:hypothetical protein GUJ93_ZPchr0008g13660 [Zizania palustris]
MLPASGAIFLTAGRRSQAEHSRTSAVPGTGIEQLQLLLRSAAQHAALQKRRAVLGRQLQLVCWHVESLKRRGFSGSLSQHMQRSRKACQHVVTVGLANSLLRRAGAGSSSQSGMALGWLKQRVAQVFG